MFQNSDFMLSIDHVKINAKPDLKYCLNKDRETSVLDKKTGVYNV